MSIDRSESLFLTVSEDHARRPYPEYIQQMSRPFLDAGGMIAAYEGIILGGADKLFGLDALNLRLRKHRYAAFNMAALLPVTHLCLEYAVRIRLFKDRPGIPAMAGMAAAELLAEDPLHWRAASRNWLRIRWLVRQFPEAAGPESLLILRRFSGFSEKILVLFDEIAAGSAECPDAKTLVEQAVILYKEIFTKYFAPDHSGDPLPEQNPLDDSLFSGDAALPPSPKTDQNIRALSFGRRTSASDSDLVLSDDDLAQIPDYIERNFGRSFKTGREMEETESLACVGVHEGRKLLFTDGLQPVLPNSGKAAYDKENSRRGGRAADPPSDIPVQQKLAAMYREANLQMLSDHEAAVHAGIRSIGQAFRNALHLMSDPESFLTDHGSLMNSLVWKAGRVDHPQLFRRTIRREQPSVVVELLIDASGSQSVRQGMTALQSYLFSAALTSVHIPHRVMSYCTYGDHTILHRFRDYDDAPDADLKIFDYHASSNNRDGLVFAAAGIDLLRRKENHKIMIIFSDGLPNDMVSGRIRPGMQKKYIGRTAVDDTCAQVRTLRRRGAWVLGIFLGDDSELDNERLIYGSSFLRIRRAEDFSGAAGRRLRDMLSQIS